VTAGDREGLVARIRQVRRVAAVRDQSTQPTGETESLPSTGDTESFQTERVRSLETRVAHLERMVEGLQDSVHRESDRHSKLIAEIQAQIEPAAMRTTLADDARTRGL
jgi:uncharacterized coiled-coil protein SlyX